MSKNITFLSLGDLVVVLLMCVVFTVCGLRFLWFFLKRFSGSGEQLRIQYVFQKIMTSKMHTVNMLYNLELHSMRFHAAHAQEDEEV